MSNFEARLAATQALLDVALEDEIAAAAEAVSMRGSETCLDCDRQIPGDRRAAAPFAVRCVECQEILETEKYHK